MDLFWLVITGSQQEPHYLASVVLAIQYRTRKSHLADRKRIMDVLMSLRRRVMISLPRSASGGGRLVFRSKITVGASK